MVVEKGFFAYLLVSHLFRAGSLQDDFFFFL